MYAHDPCKTRGQRPPDGGPPDPSEHGRYHRQRPALMDPPSRSRSLMSEPWWEGAIATGGKEFALEFVRTIKAALLRIPPRQWISSRPHPSISSALQPWSQPRAGPPSGWMTVLQPAGPTLCPHWTHASHPLTLDPCMGDRGSTNRRQSPSTTSSSRPAPSLSLHRTSPARRRVRALQALPEDMVSVNPRTGIKSFTHRKHMANYNNTGGEAITEAHEPHMNRLRSTCAAPALTMVAINYPLGQVVSSYQGVPPPCPGRRAQDFIIGYGSIINTPSRRASDPAAVDAAPCRLKKEPAASLTHRPRRSFSQLSFDMGRNSATSGNGTSSPQPPRSVPWGSGRRNLARKAPPPRNRRHGLACSHVHAVVGPGATINGVIFPAGSDLASFDVRECGYQRVKANEGSCEG